MTTTVTTFDLRTYPATLSVEHRCGSRTLFLSVDTEDYCMDNAYNGDHANIELSLEQVIRLRDTLTDIINTWEQPS